jgi:fatty acid desaturase
LDLIRSDIEDTLGERDASYIQRTIKFQRTLDMAARLLIGASRSRAGWLIGTAALAFAKSVENMEIGHNVSHGQWDWMNDPGAASCGLGYVALRLSTLKCGTAGLRYRAARSLEARVAEMISPQMCFAW